MRVGLILLAVWLVILGIAELATWQHAHDILGWGALIVGIVLVLEVFGLFARISPPAP